MPANTFPPGPAYAPNAPRLLDDDPVQDYFGVVAILNQIVLAAHIGLDCKFSAMPDQYHPDMVHVDVSQVARDRDTGKAVTLLGPRQAIFLPTTVGELKERTRRMVHGLVTHETDEAYHFQGDRSFDPHAEEWDDYPTRPGETLAPDEITSTGYRVTRVRR